MAAEDPGVPGARPVAGPAPQAPVADPAPQAPAAGMTPRVPEALEAVQERLRLVLAADGVNAAWEWQVPQGRILGDARFASLYGISPQAAAAGITPASFFSIIHPEDRTRIRLAVGGVLGGAEVFAKEYRIVLPGGAVRWVQARGLCLHDATAQPLRFSGVLADISEQKRAEEGLRIAQTAGGVGTFGYTKGFGTVAVSAQFCSLLGLQPARDLPVRTINAVVHPGDPPMIDITARPQPGTGSQTEFRILRPDNGELRWLMRRGEYLRDAETAGLRFSGVIYDITAAKHTEAELRRLNGMLESRVEERTRERDRIWQVSRDLYILCAPDGCCRQANPAWHGELGYAPGELDGRHFRDLVHPEDHAALAQITHRLAGGRYVENVDLRMLHRQGGERAFSWTCVPEGDSFFAAGRDVTQRNELEAQLRQSQKMEAVGHLTGGLAHDFNNLLAGISGSLELLATRVAQGRFDEVGRFVAAAQSSAARAAALTHRLLAFSRRQTLDPKRVHANQLVADMGELVERTMGPGIAVRTLLAPGLWPTLCDPNQLENALLNLCINARDAMPHGGALSIETRNAVLDARAAREEAMQPGAYVVVSVSDTGTGMPPEVMARAFDPFFTTKPLGQGTGLGLSMIYGFAQQSGGQVRIASTPGQGSSLSIYLPRHAAEPEPGVAEPGVAEAVPTGHAGTVLVVDDEAAVRMIVGEVLAGLGHRVLEAADGPGGLALLRSAVPIDLLISDVGLPGGMNGRQVADAARRLRPDLPVLFITGYAETAMLSADALEPGMQVLTKPFSLDTLTQRVQAILAPAG